MGKNKGEWKSGQTANLVRRNGVTYYAQVKIVGKTYRRSLGTEKLAVARAKLPMKLAEMRAAAENAVVFGSRVGYAGVSVVGRETLRGCLDEWMIGEDARPDLKDSTKAWNRRRYDDLFREVGDAGSVMALPVDEAVRQVGVVSLRGWWRMVAGHFNAKYANDLLALVKHLLDMQVEAGLRSENVISGFKRMRIPETLIQVPSGGEMVELIADIRGQGKRSSEECADMVMMMAYTGLRPAECENLEAKDLLADVIAVRMGDKGTKNYSERLVPIMDEIRELVDRRRELVGKIWSIKSPRRAMTNASERLGVARVGPYTCRHFFATMCLESGVDVPTVARWMGHKDNGVTLMRRYAHVSDRHGMEAAKRVKFG